MLLIHRLYFKLTTKDFLKFFEKFKFLILQTMKDTYNIREYNVIQKIRAFPRKNLFKKILWKLTNIKTSHSIHQSLHLEAIFQKLLNFLFSEGEGRGRAFKDKKCKPESDPNVSSVVRTSCNDKEEGEHHQDCDGHFENILLFIACHECHPDVCYHACMPWEHQVSTMYVAASQSKQAF